MMLTIVAKYKKIFPLVVGKTKHNILVNLGDPFLVGASLPHWRWHQVTKT